MNKDHPFSVECTHCKEMWIAERRDVYWLIGKMSWDNAIKVAVNDWWNMTTSELEACGA